MQSLLKEIELHSKNLPDIVQQEVLDFIKFKEKKIAEEKKAHLGISLLSENALDQWNNEEEDLAWKNYQ